MIPFEHPIPATGVPRSRLGSILAAALLLGALGLSGCSNTAHSTNPAEPRPSAPPQSSFPLHDAMSAAPSPDAAPMNSQSASLPRLDPPSPGCAAMNRILADALQETPEGLSFMDAVNSPGSSASQWLAFTTAFVGAHHADLEEAASDEKSRTALGALDAYLAEQSALSNGSLSEFADPEQAARELQAGRTPTRNPEFTQAQDRLGEAHARLSECMPDWPVLF